MVQKGISSCFQNDNVSSLTLDINKVCSQSQTAVHGKDRSSSLWKRPRNLNKFFKVVFNAYKKGAT